MKTRELMGLMADCSTARAIHGDGGNRFAGKLRLGCNRVALWSFAAAVLLMAGTSPLLAGPIAVPNGSFESPSTDFVDPQMNYWQESPQPFWYDADANGPWSQLVGVFLNTPVGTDDHIVNCDGAQAAYLFAYPDVAISLDNLTTTNTFDVTFEPGKSYQLTVGVIGNSGGMMDGVTLEIGLYYLDASSNAVMVGSTTITNSAELFPDDTNLVDFVAQVPVVKASDPWAGRNLGILIASTVDFSLMGGYWDVDNVRLASVQAPMLSGSMMTNGQFSFSLLSEPGLAFEVLASSNPALAVSNWTSIATLTNTTGSVTFTDQASGLPQRFYLARQLP